MSRRQCGDRVGKIGSVPQVSKNEDFLWGWGWVVTLSFQNQISVHLYSLISSLQFLQTVSSDCPEKGVSKMLIHNVCLYKVEFLLYLIIIFFKNIHINKDKADLWSCLLTFFKSLFISRFYFHCTYSCLLRQCQTRMHISPSAVSIFSIILLFCISQVPTFIEV